MNKIKGNRGFSLVELIITIAIISILSAAIAPALIRYIAKSKKADDVAAAKTISTAFTTAMANETVYDQVMNADTLTKTGSTNTTTLLLCSTCGDEEWSFFNTATPNPSINLDALKAKMNEICPPAMLKFKDSVTASDSSHSNQVYCLGTYDDFVPNGWAVGINPTGEMCIYVTNGEKSASMKGVALSPIECADYQ